MLSSTARAAFPGSLRTEKITTRAVHRELLHRDSLISISYISLSHHHLNGIYDLHLLDSEIVFLVSMNM